MIYTIYLYNTRQIKLKSMPIRVENAHIKKKHKNVNCSGYTPQKKICDVSF